MGAKLWNRRQVLQSGAQATAYAVLGGLAPKKATALQLPPPEPLQDDRLTFVTTTEASAWQKGSLFKPTFSWEILNLNVDLEPAAQRGKIAQSAPQIMEGFGACFNELGWTSLLALSEPDRESVLHELFAPAAGARLSYCRMPIGANDFATEAYSYAETDGDFDLKHFSIEHDRNTLIPFIQAALRHQPKSPTRRYCDSLRILCRSDSKQRRRAYHPATTGDHYRSNRCLR